MTDPATLWLLKSILALACGTFIVAVCTALYVVAFVNRYEDAQEAPQSHTSRDESDLHG